MTDPGMRRKSRARFLSNARDDIERAGREVRLLGQPCESEGRQRSVLRGLHHAGVAHSQRRTDGTTDDLHRIIPGDDVAGDAVRLPMSKNCETLFIGDGVAMNLVSGPSVKFEVAGTGNGVAA